MIDSSGAVTKAVDYPLATASSRAPERFRSMLFDGGGDDSERRHPDRRPAPDVTATIATTARTGRSPPKSVCTARSTRSRTGCTSGATTPNGQSGRTRTVRTWCANLDPRRADRLRHPAVRLYAEYIWGYVAAIRRAPLSSADRRECYRHLARWVASRALPVAGRSVSGRASPAGEPASNAQPAISVDAVVAGREGGLRDNTRDSPAGVSRPSPLLPGSACSATSARAISATTPRWRPCSGTSVLIIPTPSWTPCVRGRRRLRSRYGIEAIPLLWYQKYEQQASGVTAIALKVLGKGVDAFRTASWVRRHDVVIVPGMGVLEATPSGAAVGVSVRDVPALRVRENLRDESRAGQRGGKRHQTSG